MRVDLVINSEKKTINLVEIGNDGEGFFSDIQNQIELTADEVGLLHKLMLAMDWYKANQSS